MLIQQHEHNGKGSFYIKENEKTLAEMTYYFASPGVMLIDHTEVDESLQGKNVGASLVEQGVEYARKNRFKIVPQCPFVKKILNNNDEYDDVWK